MADGVNGCYSGEILYASSYGGLEDYTFENQISVTAVWLDTVKEIKAVVCEGNRTLWMDFDINSATVLAGHGETDDDVDPYLVFARKYCYKRFCETYCGYFGMTEIFGYLYRIFSPRHKDPPDDYDLAYAEFVDSLLEDVRFIVCIRRRSDSLERPRTQIGRTTGDGGDDGSEVGDGVYNSGITTPVETVSADLGQLSSSSSSSLLFSNRNDVRQKDTTATPSLFSIVDDYIDDDILNMGLDDKSRHPDDRPSDARLDEQGIPLGGTFSYGSDDPRSATDDGVSAYDRTNKLRQPPKVASGKKTLADYFVNSPAAAEIVPDTSLQEAADAAGGGMEMASLGFAGAAMTTTSAGIGDFENDDSSVVRYMPLTIMHDPATGGERILNYETESSKRQYDPNNDNVYVIAGLFDEPQTRPYRGEDLIEITYAVGSAGKSLTFNAIDVFNGNVKRTGRRGSVKLTLKELVTALRSFDSNARLLNSTQLDLYSFEVDPSSLHPESFLKRKRKLYLRFVKK